MTNAKQVTEKLCDVFEGTKLNTQKQQQLQNGYLNRCGHIIPRLALASTQPNLRATTSPDEST